MSGYKMKKGINNVTKVLTFIILLLLIVGVVGVAVYLFIHPQGIYVCYGESIITESGSSIELFGNESVAEFSIKIRTVGVSIPLKIVLLKSLLTLTERMIFNFILTMRIPLVCTAK